MRWEVPEGLATESAQVPQNADEADAANRKCEVEVWAQQRPPRRSVPPGRGVPHMPPGVPTDVADRAGP